MKTLLFIFISIISLYAETSYQAKCVNSYYLTSSGTTYRINLIYSSTPTVTNVLTYSSAILTELTNGTDKFKYDSSTLRCNAVFNEPYKSFLSSLTGILIGFTIMFFAIFLTIKVGSKK
jgi:hypothetical protein